MAELKIDFAKVVDGFTKTVKEKGMFVGWWIPVSEKLPEENEYDGDVAKYYLVQNEYGDMMVARYTHSGYWEQIYQLKPIADEIVAWMPLPEPYEGPKMEEAEETETHNDHRERVTLHRIKNFGNW